MTDFQAIRQQFAHDHQRPTYHFLPPHNWMNDPNGIVQWRGRYHLFYQHNPDAAQWGNIHWGHAVSDDLVHWEDLPLALAPTPNSPDEGGVWSGCAVDDDGIATVIYTGARRNHKQQTVCLATSTDDDLITWTKHSDNPVIAAPPPAYEGCGFRDPYVWRSNAMWYMVIGAGKKRGAEAVLLYRSEDLRDWEFMYPLFESDAKNGFVYECPNFFALGDKWVLLLSVMEESHIEYVIGSYTGYTFTPEERGRLDYGVLYAPLTLRDDLNRCLLWGWLREARSKTAQQTAGWSGVQSLPRVLSLGDDDTLRMHPAPELRTLRGEHCHHRDFTPTTKTLQALTGNAYEFRVSVAADVDFSLELLDGDTVASCICYTAETRCLSCGDNQVALPPADANVDLHIFVDGSVIEVIANEQISMSTRIYPQQSLRYQLRSSGTIKLLDVWALESIW